MKRLPDENKIEKGLRSLCQFKNQMKYTFQRMISFCDCTQIPFYQGRDLDLYMQLPD